MVKKSLDSIYARNVGERKQMRIGLVCPDDLSTLLYTKRFIDILKEIPQCHIITVSSVPSTYIEEIECLGTEHISIPMERFVDFYSDLRYFILLFRMLRREKLDTVINWTTKPNIYGALSARLAQVSNITIAVRGLGGMFSPKTSFGGKMLGYIVNNFYRIACSVSTKVWFTNQGDMDYFIDKGMVTKEKAILTKNALYLEDYSMEAVSLDKLKEIRKEFRIGTNDKVVVMVARLIWSKGIKEFVEASEILKDKCPDLKFVLVAPAETGQMDAVPESYIREKEKSGNLQWVGFRKDVKEIYALCDLAVLPSFYNEGGYPRALLEPMAFGKPVITTDLPQCRGPVVDGENGYLVAPRNSKALADAIQCLISNEARMKRFGEFSRRIIEEKFDDRQVASKILREIGVIQA